MRKKKMMIRIKIKNKNLISSFTNVNKNILISKQSENFIKLFIIFFSTLFFCRNYFILKSKTEIIIDNKLNFTKEDNINFSKYKTNINAIALYYPEIYLNSETNILNDNEIINNIKEQITLAKNHGIYGFAFYYFFSPEKNVLNIPLDIIILNPDLNINFFLIWETNIFFGEKNTKEKNITKFYNNINKYINDTRYIKFNNRYVIGINNDDINKNDIELLRLKFKENNLNDIFIISSANVINIKEKKEKNKYNGLYYSPSYKSLEKIIFYFNNTFNYLYTHLLYKNINFNYTHNNINNNINIFRTSITVPNNPIIIKGKNIKIYNDYTPDKFYFLNKIIIDWTLNNNNNNESKYIFINGFNNINNYLLPDNKTGYANINSLSKAIFGLPLLYNNIKYNLTYLKRGVFVLVQAHVFYVDLLPEVVEKTNNIKVPFDLYITTNSSDNKLFIENYLKKNSYAKKYNILITQNKGRDAIPFLYQLKNSIMKYKYICHIHTKKHGYTKDEGENWRIYLYGNLLGNENITSKILTDFENNEKLGFFFPEHYHIQTKFIYNWNKANAKYVNYLLEILFPKKKIKVGNTLDFPVGNMFWARTKAIYQLFNDKIINLCPKENGQIDGTPLHAIERIWLYLVKINGYYYKNNLYYLY